MYFKRPSFKRGGSTGIAQLTPSRQGYAGGGNIGGGTMMGSNLGTRSGFQTTIPKASAGFPYSMGNTTYDFSQNNTTPIKETRGIEEILSGSDNRRSQFSETMTVEDLYKKRGEKLKRSADWVEETFGGDNTYIDKNNIKRSRQTGEVITDTASKSGIGQLTFAEADDIRQNYQFNQANEIVERAKDDKTTIELGGDDSSITLDPLKEIEREKNFLNNLLQNKGLERGEAALVAAKAIGTAGSFKDKLDAAVDMALPIVRKRNEQDKAVTLTAYKAFKEKEATQAKASEDTTGIKELKYQATQLLKSGDKSRGDTPDEVVASLIKEKFTSPNSAIRSSQLEKSQGTIFETFESIRDSKGALDLYIKEKYTNKGKQINAEDKKLLALQKQLAQDLSTFKLFSDVPEFKDQYSPYVNAMKKLGFKEGGRVKRAIGSPMMGEQPVESQEIISSQTKTIGSDTQEKPVLNLSYDELRNRLPREITDDVVELLSNSEEALQDFAYIISQNDVDSFNLKYGVNLVIPPAPQTA
jgi:hypothetical protein